MASKVILTCDRCGSSWDTSERGKQLLRVILAIQCYPDSPSISGFVPARAEWCRACAEWANLVPRGVTKEDPSIPPPTLDDLVRAIVREEADRG